ncbi:uncharacterized protein [Drosophila pseudoobscura]|uniref:Uncharacterized protein n=1 Tax=Drosophila pseudoobscura pseudoobscura TaxID=46245 RepID=Q29J02_DROPS|nr:uncharacterized protein LOC4815887 [Drosophila pseudoobscura]
MNGSDGETITVQVQETAGGVKNYPEEQNNAPVEVAVSTTTDLFALVREAVQECGAQGDIEPGDNEKQSDAEPVIVVEEGQNPSPPSSSSPALSGQDISDEVVEDSKASMAPVDAKLQALFERQQIIKLLLGLCDGADGDGETIHIVMELLGAQSDGRSAVDRVTEQLLTVLPEQTLLDEGIFIGNERHRCFKSVLGNYAKIHAARRFIEQLPTLGLNNFLDEKQTLLARIVADDVLKIPELIRQLWLSLEDMEFFNEDTAFKAYLKARHHPHGKILRELMLSRISRVFLCVVSSTFFLYFTEVEIIHILKNCYLSVNSEIEIFLSVVLWLEHDWTERRDCVERVLSEVRFGLMPTWYLSTLDRANRCIHFARVTQFPGVQALVAKGLEDAVALKKKPCDSSSNNEGNKKDDGPLPREWIADPACLYHHKCHCQRFVYPTYEVFKQYLARIISCAPYYWRTFRPAQEVYRNQLRCCSLPNFQ